MGLFVVATFILDLSSLIQTRLPSRLNSAYFNARYIDLKLLSEEVVSQVGVGFWGLMRRSKGIENLTQLRLLM